MSATAKLNVQLNATFTKTHDGGNIVQTIADGINQSIAAGSGAAQIEQIYSDSGQVTAAGSPVAIDLVGSANKDAFQDNLAIERIVALYVENLSTSTGNLLVGAGTACVVNFTNAIVLPPNSGMLIWCLSADGIPAVPTTSDILQLDAATGAADYVVHVLGSS